MTAPTEYDIINLRVDGKNSGKVLRKVFNMNAVRQQISRVIFFNALLSVASLALGLVWAALWYSIMYSVIGAEYPIRWNLQNPTLYILCAAGVFSGTGSCWICFKYALHLHKSYVTQTFGRNACEIDSTDGQLSNFARILNHERMFWAGTLPDAQRVQVWFALSSMCFVIAGFLQLFIYTGFVLGLPLDGELVSN